jgi:hypothetical protein
MASQPAHQAGSTTQRFFTTQAGGCTDSACGAVRPASGSEVASPSAPLSSHEEGLGAGALRLACPSPNMP